MKKITLLKMLSSTVFFMLFSATSFSQTVLTSENFNAGFGIWANSTGVSISNTAPYQGANSVRFRGNNTGMTLTSPALGINTSGYDKIDVKFFLRRNANTGESVTLQYRSSTLASWQTVRVYDGDDMPSAGTYHAFYGTLFSTDYTFGLLSQFRFISTIGDSARSYYLDNVSIIGTTFNTITNGPGGVTTNLETWLRADKVDGTGVITDNTDLDTWQDIGKGNDANVIDPASTTITNRPSYKNNTTNNINFNPVVYFNNNPSSSGNDYTGLTNKAEMNGTGGFATQEQYIVVMNDTPTPFNSTTPSIDVFCAQGGTNNPYDNDGTGFGFGRFTVRFDNEVISYCHGSTPNNGTLTAPNGRGYGVNHNGTGIDYNVVGILSSRNNTAASPTGNQLFLNANRIDNQEVGVPQFTNFTNRRYWLGRSQIYNGSFGGRIAEVITYSARKNDTSERRRIESYLALKYGITLGVNGTSMNYEDSNGNVVWNQSANSGFNFDIAGIFRDDSSQHNQKQSRSINPTEVMTIGLTDILPTNTDNTSTFPTNRSYLVWGANGGTMVDSGVNLDIDLGPTTITTITEVVNRKWKLVETGGDVGTVRVNIPTASFLSGLPALGPTDAYVMVVATNATFTTGLETVFMSTIGSNETCIYDFDGTKYITFGVAHRAVNPLHITLDGIDDFVRIDNVNELPANFTVMTWVRPNGANTLGDERTILSKKAAAGNGYQIVLQNDNRVRFEWYNGGGTLRTAITTTALPNGIWHNIAYTYTANTLSIYIDGVLEKTAPMNGAPGTSTGMFSIGGQYINKTTINNLFRGDIDELRMWSRVLTATEMRFILNQEILQNGTGTTGTVIPSTVTKNDISGLLWNNLYAYYSMNSYIGTHLDDDSINVNRGSLVIPDKISINPQTAPMPYESTANGSWATTSTWRNGAIQDVPYSLSIINGTTEIAWNIVRTDHNVTSNGNKDLLGLFVDVNTLTATNDSKIEITHYLKLDGKIDLVDKSQLIQVTNSDLDPTSAGSIERDQQGTKNVFNYNYWSSPVGTINNTTNNNPYSVSGVMKDGTTTTPQNITWTSGLSGSPTNPITLSSYWIFKFQNLTPLYANWTSVGTTGMLNAGQGYTLKGSGAMGPTQNFTFVGKPNNGTITSAIAANNLNLSGNPYASAIDATQFITDNAASTTGSIYFWEHAPNNTTHVTAGYQGGYSARNLTGGVPPVAPAGITGLGSSVKIPNRYIPVGQGFFITGSAAGGTITFNNGQRLFVKEDNGLSNYLFKNNTNATLEVDHFNNNLEDEVEIDTFKKIRLGYQSSDNFYKQALLGFMESNATDAIDFGYDAVNIDSQANDLYFISNGVNLNIQGVGYFDVNAIFPIGIKNNVAGNITFQIDEVLNFDNNFEAFIHDNLTGIYHNVRNVPAVINVPQGTINNRFSLTFKNNSTALGNENFDLSNGIQVAYTNTNSILNIKNYVVDTTVESVALFNLLGQSVGTWDVENQNQQDIQLPITKLSTGTYIVKVRTDKGDTSRKIIIK